MRVAPEQEWCDCVLSAQGSSRPSTIQTHSHPPLFPPTFPAVIAKCTLWRSYRNVTTTPQDIPPASRRTRGTCFISSHKKTALGATLLLGGAISSPTHSAHLPHSFQVRHIPRRITPVAPQIAVHTLFCLMVHHSSANLPFSLTVTSALTDFVPSAEP